MLSRFIVKKNPPLYLHLKIFDIAIRVALDVRLSLELEGLDW